MQSAPAYAANTLNSLAENNCLSAQTYNKLRFQGGDCGEHRCATTYSSAARQTMVRGYVAQSLTSTHTLSVTVLLQEILKGEYVWQPMA